MKRCTACRTENDDANKFCQQCGRLIDAESEPPEDATVHWKGGALPGRLGPVPAVPVEKLFAAKARIVIGRAADCDVVLPHPLVSRYHAVVERRADGLRIGDLSSVNGVFIGGKRITDPVVIKEGEQVGIGPFLFSLRQGVIHSLDNGRSLRLEARGLEKVVGVGRGKTRKLLDGINLVVEPGEFVSLLGPSGSGKSTLMDCLNGRRRATGGKVLANGENFYRHFDSFRQSLGYVPQKDIVHYGLTVQRALYYTARLRLPTDTSRDELRHRIESVMKEMELVPHRATLIANLSGGQIKRVSLGAELLAKPCLLYIDEATSGLDAGTEARMMRLFRRLADDGRSILCITHNVDNVDQCHLVLVLARGKLVFLGPPAEAPKYFGVSRISDIYDRISEKAVEEWEKQYRDCDLHKEFLAKRQTVSDVPGAAAAVAPRLSPKLESSAALQPVPSKPLADRFRRLTETYLHFRQLLTPLFDQWRQFRVLTARYVELILGDRRGLALLLLQAPIVGLVMLLGFWNMSFHSVVSPFDMYIGPDGELTADARAMLDKWTMTVDIGGQATKMTGADAFNVYRQVSRQLAALGQAPGHEAVEKYLAQHSPIVVEYDKKKVALTVAEVQKVLGNFEEDFKRANPRNSYMLLFMVVIVVMWFGCNNAAKEIVKEEAIYSRERAVNLGVVPYLASKFVVLSVVTMLHTAILMGLIFGALEMRSALHPEIAAPPPEFQIGYPAMFGVLTLLAMTGVAFGLLLSACVATPDRANALLPYVLIPQFILGGGFLSVRAGMLPVLAWFLSPVYWAYRAVHLGANQLPEAFPGRVDYADGVGLPCLALAAMTFVLLALTYGFLHRKTA
ncbi:MAG TPA: ATP-binding cassette domain-containing protein [Gemmataceae bacterium]|nr:ATP-binding cassette domain-containing protein [Gemmataceae bacterium]